MRPDSYQDQLHRAVGGPPATLCWAAAASPAGKWSMRVPGHRFHPEDALDPGGSKWEMTD